MTDATIRAFCARQRELLKLELQSEQQEADAAVSSRTSSSSLSDGSRSHVLHHLQAADVSLGLYGRTVVRLEAATASNKGNLLPAHRFTTGDQVEIRSKSSSDRKHFPGGVINQVTEESISVALFSSSQRSKNKQSSDVDTNNANEDDDDNLLLGGTPPYSLLPKSSIEVHNKLMLALDELEKRGTDHPVAGAIVRALFEPGNSEQQLGSTATITPFNPNLDDSQRAAIAFCLDNNKPVALIHGPPGSGKTTTIVETIQQAVHCYGYHKILVAAPSNVAVDNVLARLVETNNNKNKTSNNSKQRNSSKSQQQHSSSPRLRVVRLGHPARLQAAILPYSLEALVHAADETEIVADVRRELEQLVKKQHRWSPVVKREMAALRKEVRDREQQVVTNLMGRAQVILATCVGAANSRLLNGIDFDLVVIDEAAQALEAACWIPALRGRKLILAGDHCQLPPTILSNDPQVQEGLSTTMFERLMLLYGDDHDGSADKKQVAKCGRVSRMLQVQYRMHQKIADWASQALYGGALQTHESVRDRTLAQLLQGVTTVAASADDNDDISQTPLLLIDTAGCDMHESTNAAGSRFNEGEAELVCHHVRRLLDMGVQPEQIAIITPYNGQVEILRTALLPAQPKLEIRSVDGFQGGEREAVVLCLVRSSERGGMSGIGFLRDDRRLNVAVTRAKRHCCVICDSDTVSQSPFVQNLVSWIEQHGEQRSALEYVASRQHPNNNNDGQIESDMVQAQIEMEKLLLSIQVSSSTSKTEQGQKAKDSSKQADTESDAAEKRQALLEKIKLFVQMAKPGAEMRLSPQLSKADRKAVHELAEELNVDHCSTGVEGVDRRMTISIPLPQEAAQTADTDASLVVAAAHALTETIKAPPHVDDDDDEIDPEQEQQQPPTMFAALGQENDESDEEIENSEEALCADGAVQHSEVQPLEAESPALNNVLGSLAKERARREKQRQKEVGAATAKASPNKKTDSKKKKGQKLGGTSKKVPPPTTNDTDDLDDDMAFLDAQIDKVQNSHGRTLVGKGSGYRTMMNGILISKPAPAEKQRDSRASAALQSKLKQAQSDRKAKPKTKK